MARLDAAFTRSFYPKQIGLGIVIILVGILIAFWFRPDPHLLLTISMDDAVEAVAISSDARYLAAGIDRGGLWCGIAWAEHRIKPLPATRAQP